MCERRITLLVLAILVPLAGAADPEPARPQVLEETLRGLEKDIAAVRGLAFKKPVQARVIARPRDAAGSVQGYYSIKDKTLFVYDDIKGSYERGVLIHEMVHALQDQHFDLQKLHQTTFASDAEMALAALIEGDATFTMIELLKKDQPRVAMMLDTPLDKARDLQKAFLYSQGARYVKALKERGGWNSVNIAYRFHPGSTAAVLHPDERISTIDLGPGKTVGEYILIKRLAAFHETAPQAFQAAHGWRGDRLIERDGGKAWMVVFARDARPCFTTLIQVRQLEEPGLKSLSSSPTSQVWQTPAGAVEGVLLRGQRVLALEAPDRASYQKLVDRLEGPLELEIYAVKERQRISFGELLDRLLQRDLVCIGETHNSELHHRVQLQIIKGLYALDERLGVGMEMFQRPFQQQVDRYCQGELAVPDFLKATEYDRRWGFDWSLYSPIAEFCRNNRLPLAALNAPKELTGKLSRDGLAKLSEEEKKQLGDIDFQVPEHRAYWYDRLAEMHGRKNASAEEKERGYQVMTTWDDYMAQSAARFQQERGLRRLVVLAGSGHIERGFGIPARTTRRTGGQSATLKIDVGGDPDKLLAEPVTDYLVVVRP
jgi:uncharacterized iron-regulated protein